MRGNNESRGDDVMLSDRPTEQHPQAQSSEFRAGSKFAIWTSKWRLRPWPPRPRASSSRRRRRRCAATWRRRRRSSARLPPSHSPLPQPPCQPSAAARTSAPAVEASSLPLAPPTPQAAAAACAAASTAAASPMASVGTPLRAVDRSIPPPAYGRTTPSVNSASSARGELARIELSGELQETRGALDAERAVSQKLTRELAEVTANVQMLASERGAEKGEVRRAIEAQRAAEEEAAAARTARDDAIRRLRRCSRPSPARARPPSTRSPRAAPSPTTPCCRRSARRRRPSPRRRRRARRRAGRRGRRRPCARR